MYSNFFRNTSLSIDSLKVDVFKAKFPTIAQSENSHEYVEFTLPSMPTYLEKHLDVIVQSSGEEEEVIDNDDDGEKEEGNFDVNGEQNEEESRSLDVYNEDIEYNNTEINGNINSTNKENELNIVISNLNVENNIDDNEKEEEENVLDVSMLSENRDMDCNNTATDIINKTNSTVEYNIANETNLSIKNNINNENNLNILVEINIKSNINKRAHSSFDRVCILRFKRAKNQDKNNCRIFLRISQCKGRGQWVCDNKCGLSKHESNFCFNINFNCFKEFHEYLGQKGPFPFRNLGSRKPCVNCKKYIFIACSQCELYFCLSDEKTCFYSNSHKCGQL